MAVDPVATIIAIVIMALVCRGIDYVLTDGQALGFAGRWWGKLSPKRKFLTKPLGFCGPCSVWLWGTLTLVALNMLPPLTWYQVEVGTVAISVSSLLWLLPIYWLAAAGLQDLLDP